MPSSCEVTFGCGRCERNESCWGCRQSSRQLLGLYCWHVLGGVRVTARFESSQWLSWFSPYHLCWDSDFKQQDVVYPVRVLPRSEYVVGNAYPCVVSFQWHTFSVALIKRSCILCVLNTELHQRERCTGKYFLFYLRVRNTWNVGVFSCSREEFALSCVHIIWDVYKKHLQRCFLITLKSW